MKLTSIAILIAAGMTFGTAHAQSGSMKGMDMNGGEKSQAKSHHAVGTVKSVDAGKGIVTLSHEPVASMNWPAMTMTFKAKDKKMLESVKPGQKVEVDFEKQGKDHVITKVK